MKNLLPFILLFIISFSVHALKQDDLLPPDKAFQVSASAIDAYHIRLSWKIAEGYYLYKDRITFDSEHDDVTFNRDAAIFPQGDIKDDPNFGKLEVFHNSFSVDIPLDRAAAQQDELTLKLKTRYQGCADAGLCYSPQYKKLSLKLAALSTPAATSNVVAEAKTATQESKPVETKTSAQKPKSVEPTSSNTFTADNNNANTATASAPLLLKRITGNQALTVDQAFQLSLQGIDKKTVNARLEVSPGHHLYRDKISFQIISPKGTQLGEIRFPESKMVNDEFFGETAIYDHTIDILLPLLNIAGDTLTISTEYQGCADEAGICYPPVTQETTLSLAGLPESTVPPADRKTTPSADDYFSGSFIGTLIAFFVIGLGLSLTPCIFPMIPILSGIIAGQSNLSAGKAFFLSLVYVLASASAYALIGLVFGFFGENLQSSLQHPIAIGLFAALFFLSTLIVGPCVAPALAAALTYIADSKDAVLGASALFSMGFGMGIILLVVGTLGGHLLPRAGAWMDSTKAIFGIMLLGMAIWMLSRITSLSVTMLLTGILLVSSGIYMGALDRLNEEANGWDRFWKSTGLILLFFGSTQLLGVATGSQNFLHPLQGVFTVNVSGVTNGAGADQHAGLQFRPVKKSAELDAILEQAKQANQAVMLDFYADWCITCKIMEKEVFNTPEIKNALENVVVLQADVTANDEHNKALQKRFGIIGPPSIIFFNTQGEEIKTLRLIGAEDLPTFRQRIQRFRSNF